MSGTSGLDALRADRLRAVVAAVAGLTVLSGLGQLVLPGVVLDALGADSTPTSRHFFAIVGMFMAVVGGVTLQALLAADPPSYVVLWCAVQKAGAVVAVTVGVARDLFAGLALLVAAFDLASAVLAGLLWHRMHVATGAAREQVPA
jgi:hypothetical protein